MTCQVGRLLGLLIKHKTASQFSIQRVQKQSYYSPTMAPSTVPAFVHKGDWSVESDDHPAMKWMNSYTKMVDRKVWETEPWQDWHTDDYVLIKSDGTKISGGEAAWKALAEIYGKQSTLFHTVTI
jgi:hypothetical protein